MGYCQGRARPTPMPDGFRAPRSRSFLTRRPRPSGDSQGHSGPGPDMPRTRYLRTVDALADSARTRLWPTETCDRGRKAAPRGERLVARASTEGPATASRPAPRRMSPHSRPAGRHHTSQEATRPAPTARIAFRRLGPQVDRRPSQASSPKAATPPRLGSGTSRLVRAPGHGQRRARGCARHGRAQRPCRGPSSRLSAREWSRPSMCVMPARGPMQGERAIRVGEPTRVDGAHQTSNHSGLVRKAGLCRNPSFGNIGSAMSRDPVVVCRTRLIRPRSPDSSSWRPPVSGPGRSSRGAGGGMSACRRSAPSRCARDHDHLDRVTRGQCCSRRKVLAEEVK